MRGEGYFMWFKVGGWHLSFHHLTFKMVKYWSGGICENLSDGEYLKLLWVTLSTGLYVLKHL